MPRITTSSTAISHAQCSSPQVLQPIGQSDSKRSKAPTRTSSTSSIKADSARRLVDEELKDRDVVVVFGRYFISTPDLVFRLEKGIDFSPYDRDTFYIPKSEKGYTDYPFSEDFKKAVDL